jgi:F-type H+-transporting ATPase subunit delta
MVSGSLSRRYAKALLSLGIENRTFDQLARELEALNATVESSSELKAVLSSPVFPLAQRKGVLAEVLRRLMSSVVLTHFAQLVLDHNRFEALPGITRAMRELVDQQANRVRATVTSPRAIGEAEAQRIRMALERTTGKTVLLERKQDPALIGGVVVQIGDVVYDGSVRSQLDRIQEQLLTAE